MTLSPTAVATARRNLHQRIERFLVITPPPTAWQADLVLIAIEELEAGRFGDGEWMMSKAERPDIWQPTDLAPGEVPRDAEALRRRLADVA